MKKKHGLIALGLIGAALIGKSLINVKNKINTHLTDFKLKGWKKGSYWFSIKVAFDNDSNISIPLSSVSVSIYSVVGSEKTLVAKSKPATNRYTLKANSRTELDDILISVGLLSIPSNVLNLLKRFSSTAGSLVFEVVAEASAAGQNVTETKQFKV